MKNFLKKEDVASILIRAEKNLRSNAQTYLDIKNLCSTVLELYKENSLLKKNLFELEHVVPEDQQWQNVISNKLDRAIAGTGKDYLEINNSINKDIYTISIQRKFGKTPKQFLEQSEIRRLKASNKIVNLINEKRKLEASLAKANEEVKILRLVGSPTLEGVSEARDKLEKIIRVVNGLIHSFNSQTYRYGLNKLHHSIRNSFHEAWGRAVESETKALKFFDENQKLKNEILKKKYPLCKIYRKRRKKPIKKRFVLFL